MEITNRDLTRRVLTALNPNKILSEDQLDKRISIIRRFPPFKQEQQERAVIQSKEIIENKIKESSTPQQPKRGIFGTLKTKLQGPSISRGKATRRLDISEQQPKRGIFGTLKTKLQGPSISRGKATRRLDISEQQPKKGFLNRFRSTSKPASINTRTNIQKNLGINQKSLEAFKQQRRTPVKKEINDIPLQNIFPQESRVIKSVNNPLFKSKTKKGPKPNIKFENVFPQKNTSVQSTTNPMLI